MYPRIEFGAASVSSYTLAAILAMTISGIWTWFVLKKNQYTSREIMTLMISVFAGFVIGARLFNYVVNFDNYQKSEIPIWVWQWRGFSVYGGIIASLLVILLLHRRFSKSIWVFLDQGYVPFSMGFIVSRLGCFMNGCCYGKYTDNLLGIPLPETKQEVMAMIIGRTVANSLRVHPTQLYEIVGVIILLSLIIIFQKKLAFIGAKALAFGILFTMMRLIVFFYRELPYSDLIMTCVYPVFYIVVILAGMGMLYDRYKRYRYLERMERTERTDTRES